MNPLESAAAAVLIGNWRGSYTVPAGGLYPHQWSWDSAFIAIGLRHLSPRRAQQELDTILSAQWADGRLPQIVFHSGRDDGYSPGASFWQSSSIPGSSAVQSAGLIQPPNHALAVLLVHEADAVASERRRFLERAYLRLVRWHEYLRTRRGGDEGLARIVHPWESGMDNSPYWDACLAGMTQTYDNDIPRPDLMHASPEQRPSNHEYGKYLYLAARYRDHGCDDADADFPFQFEDPAFNALWARSELALATIAELIGADPEPHRSEARRISTALEALWSEDLGCYVARNTLTGGLEEFRTVSGLVPLLLPSSPHTGDLLDLLRGPHFRLGQVAMVPSHDLTAATFDSARYWRGPSWFNIAWLIAEALFERGFTEEAERLSRNMDEGALAHDFPEYLDPYSFAPRGTRKFSWTAALSLDLSKRLEASRSARVAEEAEVAR
ncbi:MGH1-like glycoside hydrolase domain-containing protein [Diaminobutyricibacter sp. McL0618]|uniref:MGH1-like glycoside hydrolase domain-containing protein n=1 Tax=Leifsonia sp. McL0618 TaxID=3415677 RepID=UPI003CF6FC88